jgi:N-acetylglucosamine-6-phosphate deacetylase
MIVLAGGDLILPGRVVTGGSLVVEGDRIVDVGAPGGIRAGAGVVDVSGHYVVPGFVDVHVHGILGHDTLDAGGAVTAMAAVLPRYGVTAFCPTSVACGPATLRRFLAAVRGARRAAQSGARVLRAHLESNFINPDYRGAQRHGPWGGAAGRAWRA